MMAARATPPAALMRLRRSETCLICELRMPFAASVQVSTGDHREQGQAVRTDNLERRTTQTAVLHPERENRRRLARPVLLQQRCGVEERVSRRRRDDLLIRFSLLLRRFAFRRIVSLLRRSFCLSAFLRVRIVVVVPQSADLLRQILLSRRIDMSSLARWRGR